ncbi:MAG: glycoside hydrolase family 125 protein [Meiothermus sp.]|uniref:glycoside hydrolase family 125 protein n=1 Tax=Meiothermus sp. TaxID=1955249 RepID=UPI0025FC7099|nr:glycoside hydrolase family 125 protein [Meiothermus sp.]MCS7058079.1 glycoside hydrolase family 125 protein [Meiothermus sp.]MCS7194044.1 glycoside hydrolase family 125 protein [Meiothermus sp.]MCX7740296.1 glycoside hydrolase family 125 protein [Meiothermus sp.]MDW8091180.1 glycoside hydrolase family 125 protein [Meiothermus sp.]MDW8480443.1 glycoside hydrolase family 125 protein [Meiothermus sp.]
MHADLLTPAPVLDSPPAHLPTGNLDVHVEACPKAPLVNRLGVVSLALDGLLDWVGEPLLEVQGEAWRSSRLWDWVPQWENERLRATLLAPWGQRGLALRLEPKAPGPIRATGALSYLGLRRFGEERLRVSFHFDHDPWTGSYLLEARAYRTLLALGLQGDPPPSWVNWGERFEWVWEGGPVTLYLGLAPEADGARTTALHLRRVGWEGLLEGTQRKLASLYEAYRGPLPEVYRRHLVFSYFYAQADSLEGEPVLLTSRSPHYYVSGAYWARDALLWFFPALLRVDRMRARKVLRAAFLRYARWPGEHAQYLSGPPLYPGFELDQAAAYPLALARYLEVAGPDPALLIELREPLEGVLGRIREEKHPSLPLYRTFLSPTDDPVREPYLTYDNALLCVALERLAPFWPEGKGLQQEARAIRETLYRQAGRNGRFAYSFEPGGAHTFADEPPGSLLLLPYLGFCDRQDPLWQATALWVLSADNPYHFGGRFGGEGSVHFPFPSGFSLANRILSGLVRPANEALLVLEQAPLDQGYAPESFDPRTGLARTGVGFAALAGLIAHTLAGGR